MSAGDNPIVASGAITFNNHELYQKIVEGMNEQSMLDTLSCLMAAARKKRDETENGDMKRKWAIFITELEKAYAWYFTFLFGE